MKTVIHPSQYSSKLLYWLLTASEAPGLSTSVTLHAQLMIIQSVLVSTQPSAAICSFHEPEQLGLEGGASSSQLQLSSLPLHLRSPSISRSQFRAGLKTNLFRQAFHWLFLWELLKRLNLNWTSIRTAYGAEFVTINLVCWGCLQRRSLAACWAPLRVFQTWQRRRHRPHRQHWRQHRRRATWRHWVKHWRWV